MALLTSDALRSNQRLQEVGQGHRPGKGGSGEAVVGGGRAPLPWATFHSKGGYATRKMKKKVQNYLKKMQKSAKYAKKNAKKVQDNSKKVLNMQKKSCKKKCKLYINSFKTSPRMCGGVQ